MQWGIADTPEALYLPLFVRCFLSVKVDGNAVQGKEMKQRWKMATVLACDFCRQLVTGNSKSTEAFMLLRKWLPRTGLGGHRRDNPEYLGTVLCLFLDRSAGDSGLIDWDTV